jgi:hypothetical protein
VISARHERGRSWRDQHLLVAVMGAPDLQLARRLLLRYALGHLAAPQALQGHARPSRRVVAHQQLCPRDTLALTTGPPCLVCLS